jgi:hypothetical protein
MRRGWRCGLLGGLLALAALPARAQVPPQEVRLEAESSPSGRPRQLQLVGGIQGFTAGLSAGTNPGPFLGVAALWQPVFLLGAELRYEAARLPIDDARVPGSASLWSHALLGLAKLGLPVTDGLRPFFGVGLGLGLLQPSGGAQDFYAQDVLVELPLVLGLELQSERFSGGAQVSYRSVIGASFDRTGLGDGSGGRFSAGLSLGLRL